MAVGGRGTDGTPYSERHRENTRCARDHFAWRVKDSPALPVQMKRESFGAPPHHPRAPKFSLSKMYRSAQLDAVDRQRSLASRLSGARIESLLSYHNWTLYSAMSTPGLSSARAVDSNHRPALIGGRRRGCYHIVRDATLAVLGDTGGRVPSPRGTQALGGSCQPLGLRTALGIVKACREGLAANRRLRDGGGSPCRHDL